MLRVKKLTVCLGLGGLMSAVCIGFSALPATASSDYTICNQLDQCIQLAGSQDFTAVYPEKWEWDGGNRDVAGQETVDTSWCMTPASDSSGAGVIATVCNGAARQEWWADPSNGLLINEYGSSLNGADFFICTNSSGGLYMKTGYYNGHCEWTL